MEILLVLLIVPLIWLYRLPSRVMGAVRRRPYLSSAIALMLLVTVWTGLNAIGGSTHPRGADYGAGDTTLRAMLD